MTTILRRTLASCVGFGTSMIGGAGCRGTDPAGAAAYGGTTFSGAVDSASTSSGPSAESTSGPVQGTTVAAPPETSTGIDGTTTASETEGVTRLGPPYPLVFVHGMFGFSGLGGVDVASYFFLVRDTLEQDGQTIVFTPAIDPLNNSTSRGEQLLAQVEQILHDTGHEKVNLIGHSQGGLDVRVVANLRPDLVASVTTICAPHGGAPAADVALGLVADPNAAAVADSLAQLLGGGLWSEIDDKTSLVAALQQLSAPGAAEFNRVYVDAPGVYYQSFAGRSDLAGPGGACEAGADTAPYLKPYDLTLDTLGQELSTLGSVTAGFDLIPRVHDGIVRVEDARWGRFRGCMPADHFDAVGQLFGDSPGLGNTWNYLQFYRDMTAELRQRGF